MKSLGVIGGLGPMATAYFLELIVKMTDAKTDQEHLDVTIFNRPSVPDRTAYIIGRSCENPLPFILETARTLEKLGAKIIAIPCITSHYFYRELCEAVNIPIINILDETAIYLKEHGVKKAGILATLGTISTGLFQNALERQGIEWAVPSEAGQNMVMELIYKQVKAGKAADIGLFKNVSDELRAFGCESLILGCTELSLIKRDNKLECGYLDALEVLALASVRECGAPINKSFSNLLA